jgi:hypothetical protein
MAASDIGMLALVVGAFAAFAGVVGWASWMESYGARKER